MARPVCEKCSCDTWDERGGYGDVPRTRVCWNCGKEVVIQVRKPRKDVPILEIKDLLDLTLSDVPRVAAEISGKLGLSYSQVRALSAILYKAVEKGLDAPVDINEIKINPSYPAGSFSVSVWGVASSTSRKAPSRFLVAYNALFFVGVKGAISAMDRDDMLNGSKALIHAWDYVGKGFSTSAKS